MGMSGVSAGCDVGNRSYGINDTNDMAIMTLEKATEMKTEVTKVHF
jgi:hypothetical protein